MKCDTYKCPRKAKWIVFIHKYGDTYKQHNYCKQCKNKIPPETLKYETLRRSATHS